MKTISRDEFLSYMKDLSITQPELIHVINSFDSQEFNEVEVIPPQKQGDGWTFQPIFLTQETEE